jgi:hypothetical protein
LSTFAFSFKGSTAIKLFRDNPTTMPLDAIKRLKQSTQYARILPIIGLSISSRGVEFLQHTKVRTPICYHEIQFIHCACQDHDLRYFAYVTREQRLHHGMPAHAHMNTTTEKTSTLTIDGDYHHHYCHVFVVKNDAMSTEASENSCC